MPTVTLVPLTLEQLDAYLRDPAEFSRVVGHELPTGWPEFPESFEFTRQRLSEHPDEHDWWMHLFVSDDSGALVGSGGFVGPPVDGTVEIGYEIAPGVRGTGLGIAAAAALRDKAIASGQVSTVIAHTLAAESASTGVLVHLGFDRVATFVDPTEGELWRWRWDGTDGDA